MQRFVCLMSATVIAAVVLFAGATSATVTNPENAALGSAAPKRTHLGEAKPPVPAIIAPTPVVVIKAHRVGEPPLVFTAREADIVLRPPVFAERTIIGENRFVAPAAGHQPASAPKPVESAVGIKSRIVETHSVKMAPRRHATARNRSSGWKNKIWGLP